MQRVLSWGVPLYAAILTGLFLAKGLTDNNLKAEGDGRRGAGASVPTAVPVSETTTPPRANGGQGSYPIPAPLAQPKHLLHIVIRYEGDGFPDQSVFAAALAAAGQNEDGAKKAGKSKVAPAKIPDMFQFLIRYEGDGIIDDNVVKFLKDYFTSVQNQKATPSNAEQSGKCMMMPSPYPAATNPAPIQSP